jgi:hypothetical protein
MEELLVIVIQCLVEILFYFPFDLAATGWNERTGELRGGGFYWLYLFAGGALGGLSLLILPHHLITSSAIRVANLMIAPILIGTLAWCIAAWLKSQKIARLPWNQFWAAFCFVLAFDAVRLAWATA